jgi:hypothetical protein
MDSIRMVNTMKKLFLAVISLVSILALSGCAAHIEDTNGDDTSLATLTMEDLTAVSVSARGAGTNIYSERRTITINTIHQTIYYDYLEMYGGKTSGVKNIMATELKAGESLMIACESQVEVGNLAVILISPQKELLHEFPIGEYDEFITGPAPETGEYIVRIGTESYTGAIILEREIIR